MAKRFASRARPFFMYVSYFAPHVGAPVEPDDPPLRARDSTGQWRAYRTPARPAWVRGRFDRLITHSAGLPRGGRAAERDMSDKPRRIQLTPEPSARERRWMREVTRQRAEAVFVLDKDDTVRYAEYCPEIAEQPDFGKALEEAGKLA